MGLLSDPIFFSISDSCKFPHILPEAGESPQGSYVTKFGGRARAQTQPLGDQLSEKLAGLNLKSVSKFYCIQVCLY